MDIHKDQHGPSRDKTDIEFENYLDEIYAIADREREERELAEAEALHLDDLKAKYAGVDPGQAAADELHDYLVEQEEDEVVKSVGFRQWVMGANEGFSR